MAAIQPFIVCALAVLFSGVLASPENLVKWASFKAKHGKEHPRHEELKRMQLFLERDAEIEAHNLRYAAGQESYSLGHTRYSDLEDTEIDEKAFGLIDAEDHEDEDLLPDASLPATEEAPESFDWREQQVMSPVKDQQDCGACYVFAAIGLLEMKIRQKRGSRYDLSEQSVLDCSFKQYYNHTLNLGCRGGTINMAYKYLNDSGSVDETRYPYVSGRTKRVGPCMLSRPGGRIQNNIRFKRFRNVTEEELTRIVSRSPVIVAIAAHEPYKKDLVSLKNGVFDVDGSDRLKPNHAVILAGYGTYDGKPFWLIRNSWGRDWGVKGYGKIYRGKNMCNLLEKGAWAIQITE